MTEHEPDLPAAQPVSPLEERIGRLESDVAALREAASQPPPDVAATAVPAVPLGAVPTVNSSSSPRRFFQVRWLFVDMLDEAIAIVRMFFDMRYHVAWSTRVVTVVGLLLIISSQRWNLLYDLPFVGYIAGKLVDVVLAFVVYKVLSREAAHYLETQNRR